MNRVKVIKKNGFIEQNRLPEKADEILKPTLNRNKTAGIVKSWITNWREQNVVKTQRVLEDLKQFKYKNSD